MTGFISLRGKIPLMGMFKYLHQSIESKLESGTSLNVNFFCIHPTAEERWRVNVHPFSALSWWWSDVQSFAEHFAHQFNGEGDANRRKHSEKSAVLSCSAAFAYANEEVFDSLFLFGGHRFNTQISHRALLCLPL